MINDGRDDGLRAALGLAIGNPRLIDVLHRSSRFLSSVTANLQPFSAACGSADLDVTSSLFSYPSNFYYGGFS
jgi:hypothetical protein